MKEWLLSVAAAVITVSLISVMLPPGKTSKIIRAVLGIFVAAVIIKPVVSIDFSKISTGEILGQGDIEYQTGYFEYAKNMRIEKYREEVLKILETYGIKIEKDELNIITDEEQGGFVLIEKITIFLTNAVITGDNEHIVIIDEAAAALAENFGIAREAVNFYE